MSTTLLVVKNRAYSKLAAAITDSATSLTVTAGDGALFPSTYPFHLTLEDEIVSCTNRATDTLTVVRAQQSTTAATHAKKTYVALNITAKSMTDLNTAVNFIEKYADYGLAFYGKVTTATDVTHFKVSGLAGMGTGWFKTASGTPYEIFVLQADGAAPEGEQTPVVAYTSSDGTFQHAALGAQLAVGDEVMILHPALASLGTKATAAATGAVTTTDYVMAYIKQLVTQLLATDIVCDGIQTDLSNATDGLGALKDLIDAVQVDLGDMADVATADDLSDITTTSALAKLRRLLLRFSSGAFSVSLDGSARTDLDALYTALGVLLGARADAAIVGFPGTNAALPILKGLQVGQGLCYYGDITTYTSTTSIASTTLGGFETGFFIGWHCFLIKDDGGAGATPQGARSLVTAFTTTTGAITLATALPAAGAVGDQIMMVHPVLMDMWNARGGVRSLETLGEDQDAGLDVARGTSGAVSVDGGEDNLYNESADTEFVLLQLVIDMNNLIAGDSITIKIYTTEDGTERKISDDTALTFTGAQDPTRVEVIGSSNEVWGKEGIRVCAVKVGGTSRAVTAYWRDAKRGS